MDGKQGPTVQRRELCSMLRGSWMGGVFAGEWMYVWPSHFAGHLKRSQHC